MAKRKITTVNEKMNQDLTLFMNEVALKLAALENYYWFLARDLSVTITAVKTIKNLLARKKVMSTKQFNKEYEKLYKELIDIAENAQKQQEEIMRKSPLSPEEINHIINDPAIGHS